jgi:FixJ family two-component response regulator
MHDDQQITGVVHIVDDDSAICTCLAEMLSSGGYTVQVHGTAQNFLSALDISQPSCAVVDLLLPGTTGLRLCQTLVESKANCTFVIISGQSDVASAVTAMKLGAVDYLEKPFGHFRLLNAVQDGLHLAQRRFHEHSEEDEAATRIDLLSAREREIFDRMSAGLVTKEIASRLGISPKTVDVHRSKISQKLRIDSPTQLAHLIAIARRCSERREKK